MTDPGTQLNTPNPMIQSPSPTGWPLILAFGVSLGAMGLVTSFVVSLFGAVFVLAGCAGWFAQVLPYEARVPVPVDEVPVAGVITARKRIEHIHADMPHRAFLPLETYPVRAGIKGGIAGGLAMIIPAILYGWIAKHSIWYPVNLLGGAGVANWRNPSNADIATFRWQGLLVASVIHGTTSILVGLLYGAMLPIMPRRPILLGGIVVPLLWSGLIHSALGFINPALDAHIAWGWFVASQIFYGVVAGLVVTRAERIRTVASLPAIERLGLETPGMIRSRETEDKR